MRIRTRAASKERRERSTNITQSVERAGSFLASIMIWEMNAVIIFQGLGAREKARGSFARAAIMKSMRDARSPGAVKYQRAREFSRGMDRARSRGRICAKGMERLIHRMSIFSLFVDEIHRVL